MAEYLTAKSGTHRTKRGPPPRYPWLTMQVGDQYLVPLGDVRLEAVKHAARRRNADNLQRERVERFMVPNAAVRDPESGQRCWVLRRIA